MADGKAYAFAFDDVGNFESLVHDGDPRAAGTHPEPVRRRERRTTATTPAARCRVLSNWNGKCIDVPNSNFVDGAQLQCGTATAPPRRSGRSPATPCAPRTTSAWTSTAAPPANGAAIQLCHLQRHAAQQFALTAAGDLVNPQANRCVDIAGLEPANGAKLQLWDCAGTANQKWRKG